MHNGSNIFAKQKALKRIHKIQVKKKEIDLLMYLTNVDSHSS